MIELLKELKDLHTRMQNPDNWTVNGICPEIHSSQTFKTVATKWPKHTGENDYPIKGSYFNRGSLDLDVESQRMWDKTTSKYAALRWELLEWCIDYLEREVTWLKDCS